MTPQEFKESLWNCYAHIENISLESGRVTQEMMRGNEVNQYLVVALDAISRSIYWVNDEYFPQSIENVESENCKSYE